MEEKRIFEWPSSSFLQPPSEENLVIRELIERLRTVSIPAEPHPTVLCCAADGGGGAIALNSVPEGRLRVGKSSTGFADSGGSGGARLSGGGRKRKAAAAAAAAAEEEEEDGGAARGQSQSREKSSKPADAPKQDFIHVRARRGQATDSHSLAERVRREKISQRMKFLQDLVPGCSKMTGKAVMLDEIINYVQSLQRQVEFLSMKLATVNPRLDLNLESLLAKDIHRPPSSSLHESGYPFDLSAPSFTFAPPPPPQEQHQNIIGGPLLQGQCSLGPLEGFAHAPSQLGPPWDDDLQCFGHVGFEQGPEAFSSSSQGFHGHTKIEL